MMKRIQNVRRFQCQFQFQSHFQFAFNFTVRRYTLATLLTNVANQQSFIEAGGLEKTYDLIAVTPNPGRGSHSFTSQLNPGRF